MHECLLTNSRLGGRKGWVWAPLEGVDGGGRANARGAWSAGNVISTAWYIIYRLHLLVVHVFNVDAGRAALLPSKIEHEIRGGNRSDKEAWNKAQRTVNRGFSRLALPTM